MQFNIQIYFRYLYIITIFKYNFHVIVIRKFNDFNKIWDQHLNFKLVK